MASPSKTPGLDAFQAGAAQRKEIERQAALRAEYEAEQTRKAEIAKLMPGTGKAGPDALSEFLRGTPSGKAEAAAAKAEEERRAALEAQANSGGNEADFGLPYDVRDDIYKGSYSTVASNPEDVAAQKRVLDEFMGIYNQGGATAQDRAFQANARADSEQLLRSDREAYSQDLAERGMGGSGSELAMMLGANQAAGSRLAKADVDLQALHEKRALDALMRGGEMATVMRDSGDTINGKNADIFNTWQNNYTQFLKQTKQQLENNKFQASENQKDRGADVAKSIVDHDTGENQYSHESATGVATTDAGATNNASGQFINGVWQLSNTSTGATPPGGWGNSKPTSGTSTPPAATPQWPKTPTAPGDKDEKDPRGY